MNHLLADLLAAQAADLVPGLDGWELVATAPDRATDDHIVIGEPFRRRDGADVYATSTWSYDLTAVSALAAGARDAQAALDAAEAAIESIVAWCVALPGPPYPSHGELVSVDGPRGVMTGPPVPAPDARGVHDPARSTRLVVVAATLTLRG